MKLYFYIMVNDYGMPPHIEYSECDAIEKPRTYFPVNKFPKNFYGSYVKKDNIGCISGNGNNVIVFLEKNADRARQLFSNQYRKEIENLRKTLNKKEEILSAVEAFEG